MSAPEDPQRPTSPHAPHGHEAASDGLAEAPLEDAAHLREDTAEGREVSRDQISLARRLRNPRTIISIVLPIIILILIFRALPNFQLDQLVDLILEANPWWLLAAFLVYYLGFPLRGYRWLVLLRGTGFSIGIRDSSEIIYISWLVNCLVPAKLGDVYRAYLLRTNYDTSLSRTFGTVFIERIFDLFAIAILGLAAGFWSFRTGLAPAVSFILGLGIVVVIVLAVGLFTMRNFGRRIMTRLPLPQRVLEYYDRFEEGVFALPSRQIPTLAILTVLIWMTEAFRLFFVVQALGFTDLNLGLSGTMFVALSASLLTAVPLTPGGLGFVEAGIVGILTGIYGVPVTEATAIALVDRAISVLSIIILGSILYVVSSKTKGIRGTAPDAEPSGA
ncbi:MAG: lysylphosphatidylglycerol synthase transmembrane domain-containing protein [Candidatus Limnocylindrales bacterium]